MNNPSSRRELFFVAAGGLAGFFIILLAIVIVFVVALFAGGFVFGGSIDSWRDSLIISIFVPILISFGAGIPTWILGTKFWRGLLAGIAAMIVFVYIELNGGKQGNYGIFSQRETFAYISAALVTILIATIGRNKFQLKEYIRISAISVVLVVLRFIVPEEDFLVGIVCSLLAWILLPTMVASSITGRTITE